MQVIRAVLVSVLFLAFGFSVSSVKADSQNLRPDKKRVVNYWTLERRHRAVPRDYVIDPRGFGYIRGKDGRLYAHGHNKESMGKPSGGGSDSTPPNIINVEPGEGAVIGSSHRFAATVTDTSGVKSVSFVLQYPSGQTQSFSPSKESGTDVWSINLQGFTDGNWAWWVDAKDAAGKGGNSGSSEVANFVVDTGGGGGGTEPPEGIITNAAWTAGGTVQTAAGRIYFEMPNNAKRKGPWSGYVCSGTVVKDLNGDRSIILTASHCVYDDANKAFARNVLFIPNQDGTSGSGTDTNCDNDPLGCWIPSFGVVDTKWTTSVFPNNVRWDQAYYVVDNIGAHAGAASDSETLDSEEAAGALPISFLTPAKDDGDPGSHSPDYTHALGYSYSEDPNFMYCAEDMTIEGSENWWLPNCGLSGGSSGGPWVQPMNESNGSGSVMSVNSWGYTNSPGMAGPKLSEPFAQCVYSAANESVFPVSSADGEAGIAVDCDP